jgi:hypothetical protein
MSMIAGTARSMGITVSEILLLIKRERHKIDAEAASKLKEQIILFKDAAH